MSAFLFMDHSFALQAVLVRENIQAIDLTSAVEHHVAKGANLQVRSAPDKDGIVRLFEVPSQAVSGSSRWLVFALSNQSNKSIQRIVVFPHQAKKRRLWDWRSLDPAKLIALTADRYIQPLRQGSRGADIFLLTISANTTATYVGEIAGANSDIADKARVFLWDPDIYKEYAFAKSADKLQEHAIFGPAYWKFSDNPTSNITLKYVRAAGGASLSNTRFVVISVDGFFLAELVGTYPSLRLPIGEYVALVHRGGNVTQARFRVLEGRDSDIEIIMSAD